MNQRSTRAIYILGFTCVSVALLIGCTDKHDESLFTKMTADATGISFINQVDENNAFNILSYEYMYNGGGVAIGDFNNDGLQDIYLTGNQVSNVLYLNKGDWNFQDITGEAGVKGKKGWKTGVTTVDINHDGLLDIYVCYSGPGSDDDRANQLFINNGGAIPSFNDRAAEFNLDAKGTFSTQASFFDYDLDGDLDMFLLNHAKITYSPFYNTKKLRSLRHPRFGNRLYRNDAGKFVDVSAEAGIHGSGINFGLGISVSDFNNDNWPDIYVTNDYEEQDYFYLNNHDGTFTESLKQSFGHISRFAMGSDVADFNNDGLQDLFVADMLPEDNYRQKLLKGPDEYDKYMLLRDSGYHHQNMRNMLQLNVGIRNDVPVFSEIGQLAGVSSTDWSWSPLFVDLDNDGWKDLFVTNGYMRDFTNMDFLKYEFEDYKKLVSAGKSKFDSMEIIRKIPSTNLPNYCFKNRGDLTLENVSAEWQLAERTIATGAAYGDIDNDGDQDLVVNNINQIASIYRNNSERSDNHFLKVRLVGPAMNTTAIGSEVSVRVRGLEQTQEHFPTRGFQSSVSHELVFGTGSLKLIDEVTVRWPDSTYTLLKSIPADTTLVLNYADANPMSGRFEEKGKRLFVEVRIPGFEHRHIDNGFIDYKEQYLIPYRFSSTGPSMASGDVNGDGTDDLFVGGSTHQLASVFLSRDSIPLTKLSHLESAQKQNYEDTDAAFFDADNDKDLDLYVVSGGSHISNNNRELLQDRLYVNNGRGQFTRLVTAIPKEHANGSVVSPCDFDKDGDIDLFVGGRILPGYFPLPDRCYLFRNDSKAGEIKFVDVTPSFLKLPGIICTAAWADVDSNGWTDLVIAGEFTPVMIFSNDKGSLTEYSSAHNLAKTHGIWSKIVASDVDHDGDVDLIAGNIGLNTQFKASIQHPVTIRYRDFNQDGKIDPILSCYIQGESQLYNSRDELLEQLPHLKKRFVRYQDFAGAKLSNIVSEDEIQSARELRAETLESALFRNNGKGQFDVIPLPAEAQFSKVNGIIASDFDSDGVTDILLSGNFFPYRVQLGRSDASNGVFLKGTSNDNFSVRSFTHSGFFAGGDIRSMIEMRSDAHRIIVCGVNDEYLKLFRVIYDEEK